jgi:uncharacterized protein YxjI
MASRHVAPRFDDRTGWRSLAGRSRAEEGRAMELRDRLEHRRQLRESIGRRGAPAHYLMRQELESIGEDHYWIRNHAGEHVYRLDREAMRRGDTLALEDAHGTRLCCIRTWARPPWDSMAIEDADGQQLALVRRSPATPHRAEWRIEVDGHHEWKVQGNVVGHEYDIGDAGRRVAQISKRWFRVRDTYGIEVARDQDQALVLAVAIAVDAVSHGAR